MTVRGRYLPRSGDFSVIGAIIDNNGGIRAMQKGLSGAFSYAEITAVIDGSVETGKEIWKQLETE